MATRLPSPFQEQIISLGDIDYSVLADAIGPIWIGGQEVIRRIYVTVRDQNWGEIAPTDWDVETPSPSELRIHARHSNALIDFEWRGQLSLDPETRSMRFSFEGEALRDIDVCRLGLILHYPVEPMIGATVEVSGPHGVSRLVTGKGIAPQATVDGTLRGMTEPFSTIDAVSVDGRKLSFALAGDLFEMEDQRNWCDASFKVYCTPLRLGFPRRVAKGTIVSHDVRITYDLPASVAEADAPLVVQVDRESLPDRFPRLGVVFGGREDISVDEGWSHLTVDLASGYIDMPVGNKIDLGLPASWLSGNSDAFDMLLARHGAALVRIRLSGEGNLLPTAEDVAILREKLSKHGITHVPILAATSGYFVEFNRAIPFALSVDGVAFPVSPTVHSDSLSAIFENAPIISQMIDAARGLTGVQPVSIAPLAWKHPTGPGPQVEAEHVLLWLLGTLIGTARAGAESVTLTAELADILQHAGKPGTTSSFLPKMGGAALLPLRLDHSELALIGLSIPNAGDLLLAVNLGRKMREILLPDEVIVTGVEPLSGSNASFTEERSLSIPPFSAAIARITINEGASS